MQRILKSHRSGFVAGLFTATLVFLILSAGAAGAFWAGPAGTGDASATPAAPPAFSGVGVELSDAALPAEGLAPEAVEAGIVDEFPVQGRLTDASGTALDGTYEITFNVYDAAEGGLPKCTNVVKNVAVSKGLFNHVINFCGNTIEAGQQLYLGVQVGADPEMTPRQKISPVPLAYTVRPGAVIKGADSYLYFPGTRFQPVSSSQPINWFGSSNIITIYNNTGGPSTQDLILPVEIPAVLYGQRANVVNLLLRYICQDSAKGYITSVSLGKMQSPGNIVFLVDDETDRKSETSANVLFASNPVFSQFQAGEGFMYVRVSLTFTDNSSYVRISGARLQLDHTP